VQHKIIDNTSLMRQW